MQPTITFQNTVIEADPDKSVLENLLAYGFAVPNSCRAGICQACKLLAIDGEVAAEAQNGLSDAQKQLGIFLACCCRASSSLTVGLPDAAQISQQARVLEKALIAENVLRLRLKVDFKWQPGQVINCLKDDTLIRSYSIASTMAEGFVELHIRLYPNGRFGQWAKQALHEGDLLRVELPFGECVYDPASYQQDLLLVATGTGLAPLIGIIKEAIANHHQGHLILYVGAGEPSHFYYAQELSALAAGFSGLKVHYVARRNPEDTMFAGNVEDVVLAQHTQMKGLRAYLCGAPEMTSALMKKCFMRGIKKADLLVDAFEPARQ
ncbi:2Fe-2S iron-sulfur cluster binding domain-containing protein [Litoribacillus peritrichatus]|uniref:FAD-binding oxidoreductase n=1 Tax=Litoribacillus peritrichatus TaxID=718191 RepID=A0ABP7NCY7_9GAMM